MRYPFKVIVKGKLYGEASTLAEAQKVAKSQGGYVACECRHANPAASQAPAATVATLAADFGRLVRDVAKIAGATVESGPSAMHPHADGIVDTNALLAKSNKAGRFTFSISVSTSPQMLPFCRLSLFAGSMRSFMYADGVLASTVRAIGKDLRADSLYSERMARSLATAIAIYMDEAAAHTPEMAKLERADLYNGKTVKIGKFKVQRKNDLFSVDGGPFVTIQQAAVQVAGGKVGNPKQPASARLASPVAEPELTATLAGKKLGPRAQSAKLADALEHAAWKAERENKPKFAIESTLLGPRLWLPVDSERDALRGDVVGKVVIRVTPDRVVTSRAIVRSQTR